MSPVDNPYKPPNPWNLAGGLPLLPDTLQRVVQILQRLFRPGSEGEPVVYSDEALQALVQHYGDLLIRAEAKRRQEQVLQHWEAHVDEFRLALTDQATQMAPISGKSARYVMAHDVVTMFNLKPPPGDF